jgi:hypothetical protein
MGGTQSKSTYTQLTDIATEVSMNSVMSCTTAATQTQLLSLTNVAGNVTIDSIDMTQGSSVNVQCVMDANKQNEISTAVANSIAQYAESKGQAVVSALGSTKTAVETNIQTRIRNAVNADTTMQLNSNLTQDQAVTAKNIGGNVVIGKLTMNQSAQMVASALMKTTAYSSVINDTATKIDQVSKSEEENPIAGIISAVTKAVISTPLMFGVGIIIFIVIIILLLKLLF